MAVSEVLVTFVSCPNRYAVLGIVSLVKDSHERMVKEYILSPSYIYTHTHIHIYIHIMYIIHIYEARNITYLDNFIFIFSCSRLTFSV